MLPTLSAPSSTALPTLEAALSTASPARSSWLPAASAALSTLALVWLSTLTWQPAARSSSGRAAALRGRGMFEAPFGSSGERALDLVVEVTNAGLEGAEGQRVERARGEALLAQGGGAIILAGEDSLVEQGPAARPMVLLF